MAGARAGHEFHDRLRGKVREREGREAKPSAGIIDAQSVRASDRDAAVPLLERLRSLHREITLVWADAGYTGGLVHWCVKKLALALDVVKRTDTMEGFVVLPRRGGGAHVRMAGAFAPSGPRLRSPDRHQRGHDPAVGDHADEPPPGPATGLLTALNIPDVSWTSHPRSASRLAFDRTPSTFAGVGSSPSTNVISLALTGS
ncbi:hypothetical protein ACFYV5_00850 [Streptomyces sp. NPDC003035]|uniref:hypothetical protein n=1 Tax=Streptomyces sp. NPDC003035 TaxID=3364676 RepID=UPI0036B04730